MANRSLKLKALRAEAQRKAFALDKRRNQEKDPAYQEHLAQSKRDVQVVSRDLVNGKVEVQIATKEVRKLLRKPRKKTKKIHHKSTLMNQAYAAMNSTANGTPLPKSKPNAFVLSSKDELEKKIGRERREQAEDILDELELNDYVSLGATEHGETRMYSRIEYDKYGKYIGPRYYIVFIATTYVKRSFAYTSADKVKYLYLSGGKISWVSLKQLNK